MDELLAGEQKFGNTQEDLQFQQKYSFLEESILLLTLP